MKVDGLIPAYVAPLARFLAAHASLPKTGCLFTWSNQGVVALAKEIEQTLNASQAWALAVDGDDIRGAMGVRWAPRGVHGWLRGPVIDANESTAWHNTAVALARAVMAKAPELASLSAFPSAANASSIKFLMSQGLQCVGGPAYVYERQCPAVAPRADSCVLLTPRHVASFSALLLAEFPQLSSTLSHIVEGCHTRAATDECVQVIANGESVEGFVVARTRLHRAPEVVALAVHPKARRKGLGAQLLNAAVRFAVGQPCVQLSVLDRATAAIALYETNGWNRIGTGFDMRA